MKTTRNRKTQPNKSVFPLYKYRTHQHDAEAPSTPYEAREIGKAMAHKVAEKVKLNLDV
jgi:hypothetical protein